MDRVERRPPLYHVEDYVTALRRFSRMTGLQMYVEDEANLPKVAKRTLPNRPDFKPIELEMGLRQFRSVSDLLTKLKADLNLSLPSFIQELIAEPSDGVTLLLELLKAIQLAQTNITGSLNQLGSRANHVMFRRALADEFDALLCLKSCSSRSEEAALKLAEHAQGLFTIAVCVMSNYSKSRVLALQMLSKLCDTSSTGHKQVSDAASMLRLRFGEPVRFKFLVGMMHSYNSNAFQLAAVKFLNAFVETARDAREKIVIQSELEQAGLDVQTLKRNLAATEEEENGENDNEDEFDFNYKYSENRKNNSSEEAQLEAKHARLLRAELSRYSANYVDVNNLVRKLLEAERANRRLREEVQSLRSQMNKNALNKGSNIEVNKASKTTQTPTKCLVNRLDDNKEYSSNNEYNSNKECSLNKEHSSTKEYGLNKENKFKNENEDECDELVLVPGENSALLKVRNERFVDSRGSLVTILANDGYTCITTPVVNVAEKNMRKHDSGLSSDSSEKSSGSPKHTKRGSVENNEDKFENEKFDDDKFDEDTELDALYAERNVLHDEATLDVRAREVIETHFEQALHIDDNSLSSSSCDECDNDHCSSCLSSDSEQQTPMTTDTSVQTGESLLLDLKQKRSERVRRDLSRTDAFRKELSQIMEDKQREILRNKEVLLNPKVRRHQSFLMGGNTRTAVKRAESFHLCKSVEDIHNKDNFLNKDNNNLNKENNKRSSSKTRSGSNAGGLLNRAKSMEFFKARLLSRSKSYVATKPTLNSNREPDNHGVYRAEYRDSLANSESSKAISAKKEESDIYDWRQDTPFWRKQGKWNRPTNNTKLTSNNQFNVNTKPSVIANSKPYVGGHLGNYMFLNSTPSSFYPKPHFYYQRASNSGSSSRSSPRRASKKGFSETTTVEITELSDGEPPLPLPDYSERRIRSSQDKMLHSPSAMY